MKNKIKVRRKTLFLWMAVVAVSLILFFFNRDLFDITFLKKYVSDHRVLVLSLYLLILTFIGLTFIPSTPFAVAGVLMFPPLEAYFINLIGIITSSLVVYYFTQYLRLDHWLEAKYPAKIEKVKKALSKKELPIIAGWSFFPVVPTDLIIYVSSTLNIPYWKCLSGIIIGEGTLNAFYIFSVDFFI
ncbi:MAG: VTT domain-containing protein [Bacteroidales bacterium]|nr:VTT domain-containing protein [Bacteroidales bacterium]